MSKSKSQKVESHFGSYIKGRSACREWSKGPGFGSTGNPGQVRIWGGMYERERQSGETAAELVQPSQESEGRKWEV